MHERLANKHTVKRIFMERGEPVRCKAASSSKGKGSMPCRFRCAGTKRSGDSGRGRRPKLYLTVISQAETALKCTSFPGSLNTSRAWTESSGASVTNQRNVQVSRRSLMAPHLRKTPAGQTAREQKTQGEPETVPWPALWDV